MAGLVPALAGHVELEGEGGLGVVEVPHRPPGALQRLDLADEDAVHHLAGGVGGVGPLGRELAGPAPRGEKLVAGILEAVLGAGPPETPVAGEVGGREALPHDWAPTVDGAGWAPRLPGPAIPPARLISTSSSA